MHSTLLPLVLLLSLTSARPHRPDSSDVTESGPKFTGAPGHFSHRPHHSGSPGAHSGSSEQTGSYDKRHRPEITGAAHRPHHTGAPPRGSHSASYDKRSSAATPVLTEITVTMVNSMASAISTAVASNAGPPLVHGDGAGTLAAGATASIIAPREWGGNVAFGLPGKDSLDSASLMEAGLKFFDSNPYMFDIDVSYVVGYTVPITCVCDDDPDTWLVGCSVDLFANDAPQCGADGETLVSSSGACRNPTNDGTRDANVAKAFFKDCQGYAYTFPADDKSNSYGKCLSGKATCCVGTEADGCMKQPATPPS